MAATRAKIAARGAFSASHASGPSSGAAARSAGSAIGGYSAAVAPPPTRRPGGAGAGGPAGRGSGPSPPRAPRRRAPELALAARDDAAEPVAGGEHQVQSGRRDPERRLDAPAPGELGGRGRRHGGHLTARLI